MRLDIGLGVYQNVDPSARGRIFPSLTKMANAQEGRTDGEERGQSWMRTLLNAIMIYFAVNAVTSFFVGKIAGPKNATAPAADGQVKPAATTAQQFPPLWDLGTKMVMSKYSNNSNTRT